MEKTTPFPIQYEFLYKSNEEMGRRPICISLKNTYNETMDTQRTQ